MVALESLVVDVRVAFEEGLEVLLKVEELEAMVVDLRLLLDQFALQLGLDLKMLLYLELVFCDDLGLLGRGLTAGFLGELGGGGLGRHFKAVDLLLIVCVGAGRGEVLVGDLGVEFGFLAELGLEGGNLLSEALDDLCVAGDVVLDVMDVLYGFVLDVFGSVCILESVVSVFVVVTAGGNIGDHDRAAVSSKRILQ